ncbi:MAG: InlB B-repeat-containing protein [Erysipelotrichaceae bacterium]|nr:InlB B-repeat-containing protein [Erysipelotrichaceae bacterium]
MHNIYKDIHISVKTLDRIIAVLAVLLILALVIGLNNRGFLIEYDARGGTPVEAQKKMYGEKIDMQIPEREGYLFEGWSISPDCTALWDENMEISGSMKLYACWIED